MYSDDDDGPDYCGADLAAGPGKKDIFVQLVISAALGVSAFVAFCVSDRLERLHISRLALTISCDRSSDLDGRPCMPLVNDIATLRLRYPRFPTVSLDGYRRCIG